MSGYGLSQSLIAGPRDMGGMAARTQKKMDMVTVTLRGAVILSAET